MGKSPRPEPTETLSPEAKQARADAIKAELAAYDDVELPPEIEEWLDKLIGCVQTSFSFDPDTYFDEQSLYD